MFTDFRVSEVVSDIRTKQIIINLTFDVDPETVNDSTVELFERVSKNYSKYKLKIEPKKIIIEMMDWPIPNLAYIVRIQNLKTILGENLVAGYKRPITFTSNIISTVNILCPSNNESIKDLTAKWEEVVQDGQHAVNKYYLEIATENAFHNIVSKTEVIDKREIALTPLPKGQYYIRLRAQDGDQYGFWSEVVTFLIAEESKKADPIYDPNNDEDNKVDSTPIFVDELNLIGRPINGETPEFILLEFDSNIDIDSIKDIVITRRDL